MIELDLGGLGFERGAHLLVQHALRTLPAGAELAVRGSSDGLAAHLRAWARARGHAFVRIEGSGAVLARGSASAGRWSGAEKAGTPASAVEHAPLSWGLAARGATVEAGLPDFDFTLVDKQVVWADEAAALYAQAAAAQWDPERAIPWASEFELPEEIEDAVVQLMTYLVENETLALLVPARFLARMHPHFREVLQLLAIQAADEARHIEVFTRRARMKRGKLGLSTAGGQLSLKTILDEPDFALASFLLAVLGEGSFVVLLRFLEAHGPDPVTRAVAHLAAQDEVRHVAFGMAHLRRHAQLDPHLRERLAAAVERRHDALANTAGLNEEVRDALVLLAAGAFEPAAIERGHALVQAMEREMDAGRKKRLAHLGFPEGEAQSLSQLHTRNFM